MFVVTRVREFYTVKMAVTFASDSADLILTWYSGEVFQGERDDRRLDLGVIGLIEH